MATKTDFTAEEWNQIRRAPFMAGLVMVAASPSGPIGIVKEMFAVGKILADVKNRGASSDLAKAVVADLETAEGGEKSMPPEFQAQAPDQLRSAALDACRQAAALVEKKARPDEAQAFKQWLVSISHTVAEAAKEGGFLGFGGVLVSDQEATALKNLRSALGVQA